LRFSLTSESSRDEDDNSLGGNAKRGDEVRRMISKENTFPFVGSHMMIKLGQ
jgi:hypothetical protein